VEGGGGERGARKTPRRHLLKNCQTIERGGKKRGEEKTGEEKGRKGGIMMSAQSPFPGRGGEDKKGKLGERSICLFPSDQEKKKRGREGEGEQRKEKKIRWTIHHILPLDPGRSKGREGKREKKKRSLRRTTLFLLPLSLWDAVEGGEKEERGSTQGGERGVMF